MGGYSSGSSGGPSSKGTKKQAKAFQKKNEPTPIRDFISGGGVTGAIVRGVTKGIETAKKRKVNTSLIGASDYQGDVEGKKSRVDTQDNRKGGGNNQVASTKSIEQPKVVSQMDNTEVKSNLITAKGPTDIEMNDTELTEDEELLKRKRRGRKRTTLTNLTETEQEKVTLSKKTLLS